MVKADKTIIKLSVSVPQNLKDRVENYADEMNISRSAAICVLLTQALDAKYTLEHIVEITRELKSLNDSLDSQEKNGKEE